MRGRTPDNLSSGLGYGEFRLSLARRPGEAPASFLRSTQVFGSIELVPSVPPWVLYIATNNTYRTGPSCLTIEHVHSDQSSLRVHSVRSGQMMSGARKWTALVLWSIPPGSHFLGRLDVSNRYLIAGLEATALSCAFTSKSQVSRHYDAEAPHSPNSLSRNGERGQISISLALL